MVIELKIIKIKQNKPLTAIFLKLGHASSGSTHLCTCAEIRGAEMQKTGEQCVNRHLLPGITGMARFLLFLQRFSAIHTQFKLSKDSTEDSTRFSSVSN